MLQRLATNRLSLGKIVLSRQTQRRFWDCWGGYSLPRGPSSSSSSICCSLYNNDKLLVRHYSNEPRNAGFISKVISNIKQEIQKNKDMKESLKKFREEREKLEQSDALQSARQKFKTVESEASKSSEVLKETLGTLKDRVSEVVEEVSKSEIGKKAGQLGEELSKTAKGAAETISEKSQALGKTSAFQSMSQTAEAVREELDHHGMHGRVYVAPKELRKRKELAGTEEDSRTVEANTEATGVELHKDSKFYQSWQNFKDNNPYVNKVIDLKMKYDESDNPVIRASRLVTDTMSGIVGSMFQKNELSETLTEICKLDPNFEKTRFLRDCENDIIPNVLEAMNRGDLEILKDWCHEAPYNVISQSIKAYQKLGFHSANRVLDIDHVDIAMGKVMEQGPVLIITFDAQQIQCLKNSKNEVVEGNPDKVMLVRYAWVLCRDPTELNPKSAWRLMEISANTINELL